MNPTETEFEQLIKQNKSTIYTVCFMFSNDQLQVDDMFQETLINLWKGFASFRRDCSPRSWIWRVSLNTCITWQRRAARHAAEPLPMSINLFDDSDAESRQIRMLRSRIHRLKPFDRAIVLLWLESMSYDEIGAIVGITAKNVGVRLLRIRQQLKTMTDDDNDE